MKKLKILVACEESQAVTKEFRKLGHEAYSCDILPCSGGHPEWHKQQDVSRLLKEDWDMIIAFPPCTHLAVSGARHFELKRRDGRQRDSIEFFMKILNANCDYICVENPVGIIGGRYLKNHFPDLVEKHGNPRPSQYVQPYEFGDEASKKTGLWLKGLPRLVPTKIVDKGEVIKTGGKTFQKWIAWFKDENGKTIAWNDPRTAKLRSKTFPGIAKAMAEQWSEYLVGFRSEKT